MRTILLLSLILLLPIHSKAQSLSLPNRVAVHCNPNPPNPKTAIPCIYPGVFSGTTGIIIAVGAGQATITDSAGSVWHRDFCTNFDNGNCIFSTVFNTGVSYPLIDFVTIFSPTPLLDVFMFIYGDKWTFVAGNHGDYAGQNSVFPDCVNGESCPYNWTLPVEADAGTLLIAWSNLNGQCCMLAKPGAGWLLEASDGYLAVEDMLTPVEGTYIGALTWKQLDGGDFGGSHWIMGIAAYKRAK